MQQSAKFLKGSILRHVITMSATNAIGLIAIFMVDLVDIYFISLLHNSAYIAAIGYASAILFFSTAICIALTTANSAFVAKSIGQHRYQQARQYVTHISLFAFLLTLIISALVWYFAPLLIASLGAQGQELIHATLYLRIIVLSLPLLALSMQMGATLRCLGDAKHAMYVTLSAGVINAILDPLFIFVLKMDLQGAAIASLCARASALLLGIYYVRFKHQMLPWPALPHLWRDSKEIAHTAFPAMLTQLATPLGNLYITYSVAQFGANYIAGWAIVGRIIPVAFAMMFAVSGAISPIIAQNYGAHNYTRLYAILSEAVKFITGYCLVVSLLLSFAQEGIVTLFSAKDESAVVIRIFCQHISITFIFTGLTFIAMALLNNLGFARYATLLNIAKVTLGTLPFVAIGAHYYDAPGILYGQALGSIVFGVVALCFTHQLMQSLQRRDNPENIDQHSSS